MLGCTGPGPTPGLPSIGPGGLGGPWGPCGPNGGTPKPGGGTFGAEEKLNFFYEISNSYIRK